MKLRQWFLRMIDFALDHFPSKLKGRGRQLAFYFKVASAVAGVVYLAIGVAFFLSLVGAGARPPIQLGQLFFILSVVVLMILGISLITFLPSSLKARFRRPVMKPYSSRTYGFVTMLAIGVGTTLGSPLFIIIPENITQYAVVSLVSMVIASALSFGMAYAYANMFRYAQENELVVIGGASFARLSSGTKSVRYFVARVSMWVGNTALAAYSAVIFYEFVFTLIPSMAGKGSGTETLQGILLALFLLWFIVNAFYERRFIKLIGRVQVVLVLVIALTLLVFGLALIGAGHGNFSGLTVAYQGNFAFDLIVNTGYLYILFFGFQEIMTLNLEGRESVKVSRLRRVIGTEELSKNQYIYLAMIFTVLISAAINIIVALGVFSLHLDAATVSTYSIPVITVARAFLGSGWALSISAAFMIATITTFIPAFLTSSRHLGELARDGFFPQSFSDYSWVFVVAFVVVLSLTKPDFLANITDFTVLISLGIIMLSSVGLLRSRFPHYGRWQWISITVGLFTFLFSASLFFNGASIVAFGALALFLTYVFYDAYELGSVGIQALLFFVVLSLSMIDLLFPPGKAFLAGISMAPPAGIITSSTSVVAFMIGSLALILVNLYIDLYLVGGKGLREFSAGTL